MKKGIVDTAEHLYVNRVNNLGTHRDTPHSSTSTSEEVRDLKECSADSSPSRLVSSRTLYSVTGTHIDHISLSPTRLPHASVIGLLATNNVTLVNMGSTPQHLFVL